MLVALVLVLVGSAAIRMHRVEWRGMGHTESYTPNIELPSDYGNPRARLTLVRTITNSLWEPHPPGWYVLMWGWTKLAGTSLVAIRLPAVFFGVVVVLLTFVLGRLESNSAAALLGAALVGFNGHQILWSQVSRPSTLLCALALLSTILLVLAIRESSRRYAWWYVTVVVAGVSIEHYFWLLLAGQMAFCVLRHRTDPKSALPALAYQLFALIAAAPLLTLIVFQRGANYLESDAVSTTSEMLGFGFLFEHDLGRAPALVDSMAPVLAVLGGALAVLGLRKFGSKPTAHRTSEVPLPGPPLILAVALTVLSTGAVLAVAYFLALGRPVARGPMFATAALPWGALGGIYLLHRYFGRVSAGLDRVLPQRLGAGNGLSATVVILVGPLTLAAVLSQFTPLLASRHLLMLVPFLLLLTANGIVRIGSFRPRWLAVAALAICTTAIVGAYVQGYHYQSTSRPGPHDYRGLAQAWIPRIEPSDVILVRDHFRTTPLFYYMKPSRFNFVGLNHVNEMRRRNPPRVWVLWVSGWQADRAINEAIAGYHHVSEVSALNMRADLYERNDAPR